jgi:hypothetical protein
MRPRLSAVALSLVSLLWGSRAFAGPGDLVMDKGGATDDVPITVHDAGKAAPCNVKAGMCLTAGARTVAVASAPLVAATGKTTAPVVPRFSRAAAVASEGAAATPDENAPWSLDLAANLKRAAWNGNALFIFFDLEDPEAIENHTYTALYQTPVRAGAKLAAHLSLLPTEGFRAGHNYRIRVVQLIGGKEVLLAEGDVSLL